MKKLEKGQSCSIIYNPFAGRGRASYYAEKTASKLRSLGINATEPIATQYANHAMEELAPNVASSIDTIIVVGGDGTLREVVAGLHKAKRYIPVGFIPLGNANVIARELNIPLAPEKAINALYSYEARNADLGKYTTKQGESGYFLAMIEAGVGAKTVYISEMLRNSSLKKLYQVWGDIVYAIGALKALASPKNQQFDLTTQNNTILKGYFIVISNIGTYAKGWSLLPIAKIDDGKLHAVIKHNQSISTFLQLLFRAIYKKPYINKKISYATSTSFKLESQSTQFIQADGDYITQSRGLEITILPSAYKILAPRKNE